MMRDSGKRSRNPRQGEKEGRSEKRRANVNRENGDDGELVLYRILCPDGLIGSVIGKGGKLINSLRQETNAKIKVVDPFPGAHHRVITIYCYVRDKHPFDYDDYDDDDDVRPLCAAQDALLKVHSAIANAMAGFGDSDRKTKVEAQILVPASQASGVIGKAGATIKKLRAESGANVKVNKKDPGDPNQSCAMSFDNFVMITGDAKAVKRALYAVSGIMYKFSPREEISLDTVVPQAQGSIIIPSDVPIFPAGGFYPTAEAMGPTSRSMPPVIGATTYVPEMPGYADAWSGYSTTLSAASGFGGTPKSGELEIQVLCPSDKIGRVIGKGGISIKNVRQASGANVEVDDKRKGSDECIITVTSNESVDDVKSAGVEAVLLLQEKINDEDDDKVEIRLLVPKKVIGCLIGKGGSIINEIRKASKADIQISKGEKPRRASDNDELVEVYGNVPHVRDALIQIIIRLRDDVLRNKDASRNPPPVDFPYSSGLSVPPVLSSVLPVPSFGYDQRVDALSGLSMLSGGGNLYGYSQLQNADVGYGSLSSYSSKSYGRPPPYEMVIPANAVGKVLGKGGANLANIQKLSGAFIEIAESKSSRSERVAQISGTMEQKHMAENMIRAFIMST